MSSSLRRWVEEIPWMQQGVLFSATRSSDLRFGEEDSSKIVVRGYRNVILKRACNVGSFLGKIPTKEQLLEAMKDFSSQYGLYPSHFVTHLMHAAEIIGYQHPDQEIRQIWGDFYFSICNEMHVNPETREQMTNRLKDNEEVIKKSSEEDL